MFKRTAFMLFNAAVVVIAIAAAAWLTLTGHTLQIGGLLMAMSAILTAVIFGFRLAEGPGPDRLSIWTGPFRRARFDPSPPAAVSGLRRAA